MVYWLVRDPAGQSRGFPTVQVATCSELEERRYFRGRPLGSARRAPTRRVVVADAAEQPSLDAEAPHEDGHVGRLPARRAQQVACEQRARSLRRALDAHLESQR
jgi:hypothetical protein